jgi:hypothetical protein
MCRNAQDALQQSSRSISLARPIELDQKQQAALPAAASS